MFIMATFLLASLSDAFSHGDRVSMMRRSQYRGQRTDWHEVPHRSMPRFLQDTDSTLVLPASVIGSGEPFKMQLALHGLQLATPWITLSDGQGRFLSHLDLFLRASGDSIAAVHCEMQFVDESAGAPEHITLHTTWDRTLTLELSAALGALLLLSGAMAVALAWHTCQRHGGSALAKVLDEPDVDEPVGTHAVRASHRLQQGGKAD